jgi:HK97 family phage major capsid protein
MTNPVLAEIEKIGDTFVKANATLNDSIDSLQARIEGLEANADRPKPGPSKAAKPYAELHCLEGKAFVVPRETKLTDIPELQPKQAPEVSLDRWCRALIFGDNCEDKQALDFLWDQKSVATTSTGVLVPAEFVPEWIDRARAQSVLVRAGARTVPMTAQTLTWAHQTGDPTFDWRTGEGGSLNATDPTFAARVLSAKTVAVRTQVSLEATQDIPNFGEQITSAYTRAFAAAIDKAGIQGEGGSPLFIAGLQNTAGVGAVTGVATPSNWDDLIDGAAVFLNANNDLAELSGIVMHPNVWKVYAKLKTGITNDETPLELPSAIANVPKFVTTNADVAGSPEDYHIVMGNFMDFTIGIRMNPTIRILDGTTSMASNLLVEILGVARVDFLATRPASFVVLEGVTIS